MMTPRNLRLCLCLALLTAAGHGAPAADVNASGSTTGLLQRARDAYRERSDTIGRQFNESVGRLNEQYRAALDKLASDYQGQGNLDAVLAVRGEKTRFEDRGTVLDRDVVREPDALAPAQRSYVKTMERIEQMRSKDLSALDRGYVEHLEKVVRALTQQGRIDEASEASREREKMALSLPAPSPQGDAAPPATAEIENPRRDPETPVAAEGVSKLPTPPRDYVWVYVSRDGFPARNAFAVVEDIVENKFSSMRTDASGKIAIYSKKGTGRYRVFVMTDGMVRAGVEDATPGRSYAVALKPAPEGFGFVPVRSGEFSVPELGGFRYTSGSWSSSDGTRGRTIYASQPDVKFEGVKVNLGQSAQVIDGEPFWLRKGQIRYKITPFPGPGGTPYIEYQKE